MGECKYCGHEPIASNAAWCPTCGGRDPWTPSPDRSPPEPREPEIPREPVSRVDRIVIGSIVAVIAAVGLVVTLGPGPYVFLAAAVLGLAIAFL